MEWIAFSYSLPAKSSSSPRVALWRRLRRLGAVSPVSGLQVLPAQDQCLEDFQWLAQEIRHAGGQALVMRLLRFEGHSDQQLIEWFQSARKGEYMQIKQQAEELAHSATDMKQRDKTPRLREQLHRLRKQHAQVARIDYFQCPQGIEAAAALTQLEQALAPAPEVAPQLAPAKRSQYHDKHWVTRPRPHVDRLACAWLIRKFIDPQATIRYAQKPRSKEIPFDMDQGRFSHQGSLCTFETMLRTFELDEPALQAMAQLVHEIDLRDGRYARPETEGIDALLKGWLLSGLPDAQLEAHGIVLFEGLYHSLSQRSTQPKGGFS